MYFQTEQVPEYEAIQAKAKNQIIADIFKENLQIWRAAIFYLLKTKK